MCLRGIIIRLRNELLLSYFIIILVCITLVGSVSFYISYKTMATQAEAASLLLVQQIEKNMDNDFHSKRNLLLASYNEQSYIDGVNRYPELSDRERFLFRQKISDLYLKSFNVTPIRDFCVFKFIIATASCLAPLTKADSITRRRCGAPNGSAKR